ncbi:MAG: bifunctional diaminohydroxyphosphoribosylaminopyrimidine deaminase/5-amino-6-(5-phosphoribosylamino)uracil reductase RibD [Sulfurimonas sp.]|nr:bifunctional diaminohydroxyphosphoribosylaminopyrimidine deaminase/5-amino-6-(5-phosphoribosylamino)uracil reductase RibD [Sulfurimonas sp.]MBU3938217.1 bifunctional diaminohydroxyphosphoribosylaminopyrimidine deaminase/5-amino-6-(5-phosphoribosylamino)uracil reductase RibD [bacterium]MBU4023690.1 bifunctional diaminohydroxyphosphoribosylaminopyrimidine deaminase/5-amino-6-(5-phosphoribosylamino)uracil reductase RibD [bacterium]MBU4058350.1 bifunctional diaminohydroxyphosphoribosylaminopyrimi
MVIDANFYMNLALLEAWKYQGLTYPNPAVGCVVVGKNGELLAINAHKKAGEAHAEVLALKDAYLKTTHDIAIANISASHEIHTYLLKHHNNCFADVSLYTTLEPCSHIGKTPSCASLIASLGIKKVYVGSLDSNKEASEGNLILSSAGIEVESNILKKECDELLIPFLRWTNNNFVFFKWAQRLNATTDDGLISSKESRKHVHAMRSLCDLIVIGGNTVRTDRPTLDARLVDGKAPDVLIVSKRNDFDRTIPLFNVDGRNVFIYDNFSKLHAYKNIMIEGGGKMFELSRDYIDMYLCYIAPKFGGKTGFENLDDSFDILNIEKEDEDIIMWMKRK